MNSNTIIRGTGSVIPDVEVPNSAFLNHEFLDEMYDLLKKFIYVLRKPLISVGNR